ncbi:MAG: Ig-like domain-containing protein [Gemmatimonadetes bacterium]|nr:Ig-like domain-containing protein [Gemmatimonadota bacterium]
MSCRHFASLHRFALGVTLCLAASGCGDSVEPRIPTTVVVRPTTLSFSTLLVRKSLIANVIDQNGRTMLGELIRWSTSNSSVAIVIRQDGRIESIGSGTATITATSGSISGTAAITVDVPAPVLEFSSVTVGGAHSCGVTTVHGAYCWGANTFGQLGDDSNTDRSLPLLVDGTDRFYIVRSVTAGLMHTCGLFENDLTPRGYCWGHNHFGQTSAVGGLAFNYPFEVLTLGQGTPSARSVTVGDNHSCLVTTDDVAYCWGENSSGQLGDGTNTGGNTPTPTAGGQTFQSVSAAGDHTCALTAPGDAFCWGENGMGQLGDGTDTDRNEPVAVVGGLTFASLSGGCGVTPDGDGYCWGDNASGQLGDGTNTSSNAPIPISGGLDFQSLSSGEAFTCGVTTAGDAYCWGDNATGQLGNGTFDSSNVPIPVSGGHTFQSVAAGTVSSCGVTTAGDAYCWGDNTSGQLGDGTNDSSNVPVRVGG